MPDSFDDQMSAFEPGELKSRKDLRSWIARDMAARDGPASAASFAFDRKQRFLVLLRVAEYGINSNRPVVRIPAIFLLNLYMADLSLSIPPNTVGAGLSLPHYGPVIVNHAARIGPDSRIHAGVHVGTTKGSSDAAPTIGSNCYLGPGAKIFGSIEIGDSTVVGANAVVNRSFPEGGVTIAGIPAKVIQRD